MYQDLYSRKHAGTMWGSSFIWRPTLDLTPNASSLEKGLWLVWSHNSSLHKCSGKPFCRKVSLEVSTPKKMKPETEFTLLLLQEMSSPSCPHRHYLWAAALGAVVNSKSKLKSFIPLPAQTLGWKRTLLSTWCCLGRWYNNPRPQVENSASEIMGVNFSEASNIQSRQPVWGTTDCLTALSLLFQ